MGNGICRGPKALRQVEGGGSGGRRGPLGNFCILTIKWHVFLRSLYEMSILGGPEIGTFF